MKQAITLFFIIIFASLAFSQNIVAWEKSYGGSSAEAGYTVAPTLDGGVIVAGSNWSDDNDV